MHKGLRQTVKGVQYSCHKSFDQQLQSLIYHLTAVRCCHTLRSMLSRASNKAVGYYLQYRQDIKVYEILNINKCFKRLINVENHV